MDTATSSGLLSIQMPASLDCRNASEWFDETKEVLSTQDGVRRVSLDCSKMEFLDACGLGALIKLFKLTTSQRGVLELKNPTVSVAQILELTRVCKIIKIVTE